MKEDINSTFEAIYKKESDVIFRFCLLRVSDREQALDITQESFLRLWKNLLEKDDILNKKAFLFTVARHLIIDWYRKKKNISLDSMLSVYNDEKEEGYDPPDEKSSVSDLLIGAEGKYLLEKINELPASYKDPLYLRFVEDLSPGEIGEILGVSMNAASVRINRGLIELRKIGGYDEENNLSY